MSVCKLQHNISVEIRVKKDGDNDHDNTEPSSPGDERKFETDRAEQSSPLFL